MLIAFTLPDGFEPSPRAARAHAMKNCLTVIVAASRLFEQDVAGEKRKVFGHLQSAVHRLRELLAEDLVTEGEEHVAAQSLEATLCSVEAIVRSVADRIEACAQDAGVQLAVDCAGGEILADASALSEALLNLVANAIEATPRGGTVSLVTRELLNGDQQWVLRDAGHGIPDDQIARLGRERQSRKQTGWGLGFALARATIAQHGAYLQIDSRGCEGTCMTIWLDKGFEKFSA